MLPGVHMPPSRMTNPNVAALTSFYLYPLEKILWIVTLVLSLLGIFVSAWVFIPAALVALWCAAFFYTNNSAKWRRFYHRISMIYASVAGAHLSLCEHQGIPFDPDMAWRSILQKLYPSHAEVEGFLSSRDLWRRDGDPDLFERIIRKLNPAASKTQMDSGFAHLQTLLRDEEPGR